MLPIEYLTYLLMFSFDLTKQLPVVFVFLTSGLFWKFGDAGHRSPFLWHAKRALYLLSYIPVEDTCRYWHLKPFFCQCNSWTESSFAYRSSFGYVDAGHQSIFFSHANGLPFRLSCHAVVVQRSYLCQREVFDSHVSRTVFPSTSFWGIYWRFGAPTAFSLSSAVSDACHGILDVLINVFFWSNKTAPRSVCFLDFRSFLKILRCGASIPVPLACETSALPFELHPRWGNL